MANPNGDEEYEGGKKSEEESIQNKVRNGEIKTLSTEDVVNIVADKPSFLFVMAMIGLMSFNTVSLK